MARRPRTVGTESSFDLARKAEILERELAVQRDAIERLKEMGTSRHGQPEQALDRRTKRSA
jgi:hypothetical protein